MRLFRYIIMCMAGSLLLSCGTTQPPIVKTNRTQIFDAKYTTVFNAAIAFLQSNAYSIELADKKTGIIKALKKTSPSLGASLGEGMISAAASTLLEADEYETTSANVSKMTFYIERLDVNKTEVKIGAKSGTLKDIHKLEGELPDTKEYDEYLISNDYDYSKWFNGLAIEVMNRKTFEKKHKID